MQNKYYQKFQTLTPSNNATTKDVIEIEGTSHVLSISKEGYPMFFVVTEDTNATTQNVKRENLSVEYNVPCTIVEDDIKTTEGFYTIITLTTHDVELQESFIELFALVLAKYQKNPRVKDISYELDKLITIFEALSRPPKKKVQGLWGELLVIESSSNPDALIHAWHSQPDAKYDFSIGTDKIEVKTTSTEQRVHRFSLDQLNPSEHSRLLVASITVRESAKGQTGLSIYDLYDKICEQVESPETRLLMYTVILNTLGQDAIKAGKIYFDYTEASDSLAFFNAEEIPSISKENIHPLITGVKFYSNVSNLEDVRCNQDFPWNSDLFQYLKNRR
ncbi:MAG: PD-(D/E)XK motif protein [Bacteroidales bacterium]|nr:PD-(D/E)XK motif protein [Bacteroidales bacterium]